MNSLFWVNLLIGCGMLLSGFKQLPVTFSWRKLAVIFLASGSLLLTYPACCCQKQCFLLACSWSLGPLKPKRTPDTQKNL